MAASAEEHDGGDREVDRFRRLFGLEEAELRDILGLLTGSDTSELLLEREGTRLLVRRDPQALMDAHLQAQSPTDEDSPSEPEETLVAITSPLVGFLHTNTTVGQTVEPGQIVGTIEALGMPTNVDAPQAGLVVEVLAEDGQAVEYGQPLLLLRRPDA